MAEEQPPAETPDGAAVFPLIPPELGVHPLLLAVVQPLDQVIAPDVCWVTPIRTSVPGFHDPKLPAQSRGRSEYYEDYTLFACSHPRVHRFSRKDGP